MSLLVELLVVAGLILFETVNSIDNVIINANVLSTMDPRSRRWFIRWGVFFSVFLMRGLLPLFVLWLAVPSLSPLALLAAGLNPNSAVLESIKDSAGVMLAAAGTFLISLFLQWFFVEEREPDSFSKKHGKLGILFFYVFLVVAVLIVAFASFVLGTQLVFGALIGAISSILIFKIREFAESEQLKLSGRKDLSGAAKIAYLEVIDASFSLDGVLGAFAYTFSIPLILLGNGLGAVLVRYLTLSNVERIKRYRHLKDGAMYSIFLLGALMTLDSFGFGVPDFLPPLLTFLIVAYFLYK